MQRGDRTRRVAQEAAELLYTQQEKEYKQAKLRAARNLGFDFLPDNSEIAFALDQIAEEREGETRAARLVQLRREALTILRSLKAFSPVLVGSVWRGTARFNSDIDIVAYAHDPKDVIRQLKQRCRKLTKTEARKITKAGRKTHSYHVYLDLPSNDTAEIVVRAPEDINRKVKCEIYGDRISGLTMQQLELILKQDPEKRFVPDQKLKPRAFGAPFSKRHVSNRARRPRQ